MPPERPGPAQSQPGPNCEACLGSLSLREGGQVLDEEIPLWYVRFGYTNGPVIRVGLEGLGFRGRDSVPTIIRGLVITN